MFKFERKIIEFIEKNWKILSYIGITILALGARYYMLRFRSGDYNSCLDPWFNAIKEGGGIRALANFPGNYNAPYMTIMALLTYIPINSLYTIKAVSILFDFALAIASTLLIREIMKRRKDKAEKIELLSVVTYAAVLFLPTVLLNGALWAQCDCIYTTFVILALYFLLKVKYVPSFIMLGLAFSFKLQFMFILPVFVILYVTKKKFSILHFLIIPLVDIVLCLPALIMGWPIENLAMVYFGQATEYGNYLTMNFPNIYFVLQGPPSMFYGAGEIATLLFLAATMIVTIVKKVKWTDEKILSLALFTMTIVTFILPGMHERYLYAGEIICLLYFILYRKNLPLLAVLIIVPVMTYSNFLFSFEYPAIATCLAYAIVLIYSNRNLAKEIWAEEKVKLYE